MLSSRDLDTNGWPATTAGWLSGEWASPRRRTVSRQCERTQSLTLGRQTDRLDRQTDRLDSSTGYTWWGKPWLQKTLPLLPACRRRLALVQPCSRGAGGEFTHRRGGV